MSDEEIIDSSKGRDAEHEDDTESYIDEDHSNYKKNKKHIRNELKRTTKHSGKHVIGHDDHSDDESEEEHPKHKHSEEAAEAEDFDEQVKKETENLAELTKKAE